MSIRDGAYEQLSWTQTTPCDTCPYRVKTEPHAGICAQLHDLFTEVFGMGNIAHTCHKTDEDSDYEGAKGPLQACVGFTLICEKEQSLTRPMERAVRDKKLDLSKLRGRSVVYSSISKLLRRYLDYFKDKVDD